MTKSLALYNEKLANADRSLIVLPFTLTAGSGVNTAAYLEAGYKPDLIIEGGTGSALTAITQTTVDALLGSTNEIVVATALGTTGMVDNDTYACVVNCNGQVQEVGLIECTLDIAGTLTHYVAAGTKTAFTNATFTGIQCYVTALGNILIRLTATNCSAAATAGHLIVKLYAKMK